MIVNRTLSNVHIAAARHIMRPLLSLTFLLLLPALARADRAYLEQGDWFTTLPNRPGQECVLNTGGYDRASKAQNPLLSVTLRQRDDGVLEIGLTASAVSTMAAADLGRVRSSLRVEGASSMSVAAVPVAITQTTYDRRVTLRPYFPGDHKQARMRALIDAMRRGDRLVAEINGRRLEPTFSLDGFDALWRQVGRRCGVPEGRP